MRNFSVIILVLGAILIAALIFFFTTKGNSFNNLIHPSPQGHNLLGTEPEGGKKETIKSTSNPYPFPVLPKDQIEGKVAKISTNKGDIYLEFLKEAPISSSNFIYLANKGFYNGLKFHKRIDDSVIEGGDPNGNGTGGPGYTYPDEPVIATYSRGAVAMSSAGPNTSGSQFFILLADQPNHPNTNDIFGYVIKGMDIADKIQAGDVMSSVTIEQIASPAPTQGPVKP